MPLPQDKFDPFRDPELNPLMNPLLAANMGRWAEVYFTTVPEKREQAIYELILELRNNERPQRVSTPVIANKGTTDTIEKAEPRAFFEQNELICARCGERNPIDHRFCGICGASLAEGKVASEIASEENREQPAGIAPLAGITEKENKTNSGNGHDWLDGNSSHLMSASAATSQPAIGAAQTYPSYSDFRLFAVQPEPVPSKRRRYVSLILAILVAALVYGIWRRSATLSKSSAASPERSQAASSPRPESAHSLPKSIPAPNAGSATKSAPRVVARPSRNSQVAHSKRNSRVQRPAHPAVLASEKSPAPSMGAGGAQEFATAERYLQEKNNSSRNSAEAAQWLWKAVGKGNTDATLTLSDLYLRGDGVAKNCDQGRILLDVAARKGNAAAADRIRHLQKFGCR